MGNKHLCILLHQRHVLIVLLCHTRKDTTMQASTAQDHYRATVTCTCNFYDNCQFGVLLGDNYKDYSMYLSINGIIMIVQSLIKCNYRLKSDIDILNLQYRYELTIAHSKPMHVLFSMHVFKNHVVLDIHCTF